MIVYKQRNMYTSISNNPHFHQTLIGPNGACEKHCAEVASRWVQAVWSKIVPHAPIYYNMMKSSLSWGRGSTACNVERSCTSLRGLGLNTSEAHIPSKWGKSAALGTWWSNGHKLPPELLVVLNAV
jgi:hypothetical protein